MIDSIIDVAGVMVGHATAARRGWRTGTTVVLADRRAVGGVDVRGGGPGTRETDLLRPENMVHHVDAICLTGGSAYGLAAADGVMTTLESRGVGFPVGADGRDVVPIVPTAVIYDLGRSGVFANRPDAGFGSRATAAARARPPAQGTVGAGTGALSGGLQGGVGSASITMPDGVVVGALAVVNSAGSVIDVTTGLPWEWTGHGLRRPTAADRAAALRAHDIARRAPLNTTIGVVATSVGLTKAECQKFAGIAHDGLARAIRPAHTYFDGDTVFAMSTGATPPAPPTDGPATRARATELASLFEAGAQCFAIACTRAVLVATSHRGGPPSYRDLCPSAFAQTVRAPAR